MSVVFFSYQEGNYVHLSRIELHGNDILIQFRFVPHETAVVTEHFALIPLGKLRAGKYQVKVVQSPMEQEYIDQGCVANDESDVQRFVCGSFEFSVKD